MQKIKGERNNYFPAITKQLRNKLAYTKSVMITQNLEYLFTEDWFLFTMPVPTDTLK